MKIFPVTILYTCLVISALGCTNLFAQTVNADTAKLIASVSKNETAFKIPIVEANVVFPEILDEHKEQSIDYVEKYSNKQRSFLQRTYETGKKYFPKITAVLKRYHLPEELKVLIALESGFSANAVSPAGAVGYWQMMDVVAKEYGLYIIPANSAVLSKPGYTDERKNLMKSTIAAAKYLRDRKLNYKNDILLMVASYNSGIGTVRNAIKKCGKSNADFWDIKKFLPRETRNYVMNFIAMNVIFKNYEKFTKKQLLFTPQIADIPAGQQLYNYSLPVDDKDINID